MNEKSKFSPRFGWLGDICAVAPVVLTFLYIALAVYARIRLGHWPRYYEYGGICDSSRTFQILDTVFGLWGVLSLIGGLILWGALRRSLPKTVNHARPQVLIFLGGWLTFIVLFMADVYGFTSAFLDS